MSDVPTARTESGFRIAPIWIIPGICAAMVLFFAIQHAQRLGKKITIHFSDAAGLSAGKTIITLRGVSVGRITGIKIAGDGVDADARLDREVTSLAREKTVFIAVKPELGFEGVRGLTAIFSGPSIEMRPGDGEPATAFKGYADMSSFERDQPGLAVKLNAARIGSLSPGDGVFFRGLRVGHVMAVALLPPGDGIGVEVKIEAPYARLVRTNTVFWEASGVHARVGLLGAKVAVDSIQAAIRGGVAFATPDPPGKKASDGDAFTLQPEVKPEWQNWTTKL